MAQGFHEDSCSMTAQTKGASSFCAAAALRASATSSGGAVKGIFLVTRRTRCRPRQVRRAGECHGGSAAAQPAEKERELHEAGNRRGEKAVPMERHGRLGSD